MNTNNKRNTDKISKEAVAFFYLIDTFSDETKKEINELYQERLNNNIGFLRQWLNEYRITDTKKTVTNEDIERWLNFNL